MRRAGALLAIAWLAGCRARPVVLAGPREGVAHPYGLCADADRLYWTEREGGGAIRSVLRRGGGLVTLARGVSRYAWFCAVDDAHVYWTEFDTGKVRRVPKAGGPAVDWERGLGSPGQVTVRDGAVWWVEYTGNVVKRRGVRDARATVLAAGLHGPQAILVDDDAVYWTEFSDPPRLVRRPRRGGKPVILAAVKPECWLLRAGADLWWTETRGDLRRCPARGGAAVPITAIAGGGGAFAATDGQWIFWAEEFGHRLFRLPVGGGTPELLRPDLGHPGVMVAGDGRVYWTDPDANTVSMLTPGRQ